MTSDRGKIGNFLAEVIHWRWDEFCKAEKDHNYTGYESTVFSLVRICSEGKLGAIKLAIDRVDGKIETPIKVEYPKVYFIYPEATSVALPPASATTAKLPASLSEIPPDPEEVIEDEVKAATFTLRETLKEMADKPRLLTQLILQRKKEIEFRLEDARDGEDAAKKIPLVKSVIAANLLHLAEKNNFEAIAEVFDQIDGKLVETIRMLGNDLFLTQYALEAPYGAVKNKEGVYVLEAREVAESWKNKLKKS